MMTLDISTKDIDDPAAKVLNAETMVSRPDVTIPTADAWLRCNKARAPDSGPESSSSKLKVGVASNA
ncbi:hypothetical protein AOQ71_12255 [Bradyrhizobium manausense]|uniref:Uncharacterized protein n=1 Tax=Bradyrhizobium manausense TaxID=989370 RepID=A0A0R3E6I2_9BRAD|nr:hypothetical protein AOQ71_12255 [Bradyrhizobium manausense]